MEPINGVDFPATFSQLRTPNALPGRAAQAVSNTRGNASAWGSSDYPENMSFFRALSQGYKPKQGITPGYNQ